MNKLSHVPSHSHLLINSKNDIARGQNNIRWNVHYADYHSLSAFWWINKPQQKVDERGRETQMKNILLHPRKAKSHLQMTNISMRVGWGLRHILVFIGLVSTLSFDKNLLCSPQPYRLRKINYLSHLLRPTVIGSKICFILWAQSHTMYPLGWLVPLHML